MLKKAYIFQEIYFLFNTSLEIVFEILFLIFKNRNI